MKFLLNINNLFNGNFSLDNIMLSVCKIMQNIWIFEVKE